MALASLPPPFSIASPRVQMLLREALSSSTDECVLWGGTIKHDGYGLLKVRTDHWRAHRAVCLIAHGEPPHKGWFAMHACNNPTCVNPRHLQWGSPQDNSTHMAKSGRSMYGERAYRNVLTEREVLLIRSADQRITNYDLAAALGVSKVTVTKARTGATWKHLNSTIAPQPGNLSRRRGQRNGVQIPLIL